jgi:hypothetical protein
MKVTRLLSVRSDCRHWNKTPPAHPPPHAFAPKATFSPSLTGSHHHTRAGCATCAKRTCLLTPKAYRTVRHFLYSSLEMPFHSPHQAQFANSTYAQHVMRALHPPPPAPVADACFPIAPITAARRTMATARYTTSKCTALRRHR